MNSIFTYKTCMQIFNHVQAKVWLLKKAKLFSVLSSLFECVDANCMFEWLPFVYQVTLQLWKHISSLGRCKKNLAAAAEKDEKYVNFPPYPFEEKRKAS